jgi:hypothetical protein
MSAGPVGNGSAIGRASAVSGPQAAGAGRVRV